MIIGINLFSTKAEHSCSLIAKIKEFHKGINPFLDLCSPFQTNNGVFFSQESRRCITIGKEVKKRKLDNFSSDQILVQHYLQLGRNLEPTSVLLPCNKCSLNTHNNKNNNRCLMLMNKEEILQIPVKRSKTSTSQSLPNRNKLRIKMPIKDIHQAHQIINESQEIINTVENTSTVSSLQLPLHQQVSNTTSKEKFLRKWFITTETIIDNLLVAAEKVASLNSFSVYTDGSNQDFNGHNIMGLGWVIPASNNIGNNFEFRCTTEFFPSSTKAEIMAMITAIAIAPINSRVEILSDSQGAINIFNNILDNSQGKNKKKEIFNNNNMVLTLAAQQIIQDLKLQISLVKVKAHSGIEYNEIADRLAQVSSISPFQDPRISINSYSLNQLKVIPRWWIHTNKAKNIDWDLTWKVAHPSKISSLTSGFSEASIRKFSLKLLNDELPTLSNLYKRNPLLYTTDQCPFCQIEIENNIHIFTCSSQTGTNPLEKLKEDFKKILIHEAANILQLKLDLESLKKKLELYTSDFDLRNQHLMEFDQICFLDIIAGLIPNSLVSLFKEIMGSNKDGKLVVLRSIHKFKLLLFQLWKSRCEKFLIWERSQNIKAKDKKLGRKKTNNASNMVYESTSIRVYDDIILEQQQQTDNLQVHNYDMDYGSGEKRNSFNTAVFYAKKALANQFPRFAGQRWAVP
ncbi:hypothetical protein Glove_74g324 [Diversispora epigaea]|uniref:ribonuclease H n=1 Tax=Diversispora epigaea TaxID=1348612 RepID=A0A397JDQ4_9GLOM|nr:hypothetical protein Glove_74g324 [Diversispora epigaea]